MRPYLKKTINKKANINTDRKFCQELSLCVCSNYRFALEKISTNNYFCLKKIYLHKCITIYLIKDSYKKSRVLGHIMGLVVKTRKIVLLFSVGLSMKETPGKRCEGRSLFVRYLT